MLKYFSYYNVGGYKDMFLGDSTMTSESTFYLPLLPVWKKKAEVGDVSLAEKIESLEKLPKIKILTIDSNYGLPKSAFTLISHAGYKVYLSKLSSGESIFAIRDIDSNSKDESGRLIPFLLLVVGDTDSDRIVLEKMAAYAVSHIDDISRKISNLFSYNPTVNGVEFSLHTLNELIKEISTKNNNTFMTLTKDVVVDLNKKEIALFAIPEGLDKTIAIREQNLKGKNVNFVMMTEVIPLDNQKKMKSMLELRKKLQASVISSWKSKLPSELTNILSDKKVKRILIGGTIITAIAIGYLLYLYKNH